MTERELLIAILTCDADELAMAFSPLSESERKALYPALADYLKRGVKPGYFSNLADRFHDDYRWLAPHAEGGRGLFAWNRALALLALGNLGDAKKIGMGGFNDTSWPAMIRVLEDRRPDWVDAWLEHLLKSNTGRVSACWDPMRELIVRGVCKKPSAEGYSWELAAGLSGQYWRRGAAAGATGTEISDYLKENRDLLEDVYALFTVETVGFLEGKDQWKEGGRWGRETCARALRKLSDEGLLDRVRLLRASLDGLIANFKPQLLAGLASFHEGMDPSTEELVLLQPAYLGLLSAEVESVASFAVKMLKKVEQAKALDDAAYAEAAAVAFDRKGKALVKSVIAQLQKIGKRTPALLEGILALVSERGLSHGDADIQEASLDLLEVWGESLNGEVQALVAASSAELAASLRDRARALANACTLDTPVADPAPPRTAREKPAARAVPAVGSIWRERAGVDAALAALEQGAMPPPLVFELSDIPVSSGLGPVEPVATLDELVELVARNIEGKANALDLERILDGISRFNTAESEVFSRLAAPLAARVLPQRGGPIGLLNYWLKGDANAICAEANPFLAGLNMGKTLADFQSERTREIGQRLEQGVHVPILSLPTHEGGWIRSATLVSRLREWERRGMAPAPFDFIQALLRLAPEGRAEAAPELGPSEEVWVRALRWVLTGDGNAREGDDPDLWLAAARSRAPRAPMAVPGMEGSIIAGPDAGLPATCEWMNAEEMAESRAEEEKARERAERRMREAFSKQGAGQMDPPSQDQINMILRTLAREAALDGGGSGRMGGPLRDHFGMKISPACDAGCGTVARPTVLLHEFPCIGPYHRKESLEVESAALVWPHNLDAFFASGLVDIASTLEVRTSKHWPEYAYLTPLLEPDRPLTLPAAMLIALALCAPQGDLSRAAIDVLVESIADGRSHPDVFAAPLARISRLKWFQPGRFAANLHEASRLSNLHAWVVSRMLEHVIAGWDEFPKNGHHILELLVELLMRLGRALAPEAAASLKSVKCSGKSAKLAKQLLALEANEGDVMAEARETALQARVARAERWAGKNAE